MNDNASPRAFGQLTAKQRSFVLEYMKSHSGVSAARAAGYQGNDQTLRAIAHENLTKPHIRKVVEELEAPALEKAGVATERVLEQLAAIAFAPWRRGEAPKEQLVPVSAKIKALSCLGDYLGLWKGAGVQAHGTQLSFPREDITAEEARQDLLRYLRQRQSR
jgi:hypothetical protein